MRPTELRSGNVHIMDNIQAKDVPVASKDPTMDAVENTYQKSCYPFTFSTKSPKFADLRLRQAVHRVSVAKVLGQGIGEPEYWFLTPGYLGYNETAAGSRQHPGRSVPDWRRQEPGRHVQASPLVAAAIVTEASLSFLGAGVPPPTPTWGGMLLANLLTDIAYA